MQVKNTPSKELLDAFHLMWDNFPEPVTLVHKSREVVAGNKANVNYREPGIICARTGCGGPHVMCKANEALKTGNAAVLPGHSSFEDKEQISYWVPLDGCPDYFVHFSVRFTIGSDNKTITMSPMTDEHKKILGTQWEDKGTK